jgi:hypothetical protein
MTRQKEPDVKILLTVLASIGLSSCELSPVAPDNAFDEDHYVSPAEARAGNSQLANPRTYMDKDDPNIQRLIAAPMFH